MTTSEPVTRPPMSKAKRAVLYLGIFALIIITVVSIMILVYQPKGSVNPYKHFATLEQWGKWLEGHPISFEQGEYTNAAEYLQVQALEEGYLVSQMIGLLPDATEFPLGLLVMIGDDYYFSELGTDGAWRAVKIEGARHGD